MTLEGAWKIIKTAFETSPYLGAIVALFFWLFFCWKFRLVAIGRRQSFPDMLLASFNLNSEIGTSVTLKELNAINVESKTPQNPQSTPSATAGGEEEGAHINWRLVEIYQIYWTLISRGHVVRYTTVLIAFAALSLLIMHLAQPAESVSLLNVANMIGVGAFFPLAILGLLSLIMVLFSAHKIPCKPISEEKPRTIIFFAW